MTETRIAEVIDEVSKAIAKYEAWMEKNFFPRNGIQIEVCNVRVNSLWAVADIAVTKMGNRTVYKGNRYPYKMLQWYMKGKGGGCNVNKGGSA